MRSRRFRSSGRSFRELAHRCAIWFIVGGVVSIIFSLLLGLMSDVSLGILPPQSESTANMLKGICAVGSVLALFGILGLGGGKD